MPGAVKDLRRALLVMHSPLDTIVSIDNAADIFSHALHPKSFLSLDNADHLLSREADARYAGRVLAGWASRYIDADQPEAEPPPPGAVTARTGSGGFYTEIDAAGHPLVADEPVSVGGDDAGPSPYDLLSAALASCTTMTLQMYARRKGLALTNVTSRIQHARIHARDCENCETEVGRIDQFNQTIVLEGNLDESARRRLLEIADLCPVHRTLETEVEILTELNERAD